MTPWAHAELAGAQLPDRRFVDSLAEIAQRLAENGEESFSRAVGHAGRQAARRAFGHAEVTPDAILQGHYEQTSARCCGHETVLVVQDSSSLNYGGHHATPGLGPIDERRESLGLMMHSALAVSVEGLPLGLLHLNLWARDPAEHGKKHQRKQRSVDQKESRKWSEGLQAVQRRIPSGVEIICVQDREADAFEFIAQKRRANVHLLIRACQPRCVELPEWVEDTAGTKPKLFDVAAAAPVLGELQVTVPRRPGRAERQATLAVRVSPLTVLPPMHSRRSDGYLPQDLHVIQAKEESAPEGETAICWVLITTAPVSTVDAAVLMVRYYSLRWTIETFHYVLKSGCRVERLQIDHVDRLSNAIALYCIVAWRLLALTHLARTQPEAPATVALSSEEITVLTAATQRPVSTISEAVTAIAILGGLEYYRNAPPPGPKRLWLGIRRLEDLTQGWMLAVQARSTTCEP